MTPWEENVADYPGLEEVKDWLDQGNTNEFYSSVISQAQKKKLSQNQIESVKRSFDKIKNPSKKVTFEDFEIKAYTKILNMLANISPMGYDFYMSISLQIKNKGFLSDKQWASVVKKMYRFRKSIIRTLFTGQSRKQ